MESSKETLTKKVIIIITFVCFIGASIAIIVAAVTILKVEEKEPVDRVTPHLIWSYECHEKKCQRSFQVPSSEARAQSLGACLMLCSDWGNMWPQPNGQFRLGSSIATVDGSDLKITLEPSSGKGSEFTMMAIQALREHVQSMNVPTQNAANANMKMQIQVSISDIDDMDLTLETDEKYSIRIQQSSSKLIVASVEAKNFFGARHALETLKQFMVFDDIYSEILVPSELMITDGPIYPYRGISLDTARNFYSIEAIKQNLDAMSACKLNRFHWHMTDSHAFPLVSKSFPELSIYGAYSPNKVYRPEEIISVVQYGLQRGIRVIPEFDAPAHVGAGWEQTNLTVCYLAEPWYEFCLEPPCGQFDPTKDALYDVLEGIYKDLMEYFQPDIFHMGGDEVNFHCWNETESIALWMTDRGWNRTDEGFHRLWMHFQNNALERLLKVNGNKKIPIILWSSTLTRYEDIERYLNKDDYIIQFWETKEDPQLKGLLSKGYKMIISNHDALYFDCGFASWVAEGHNWCSPYIGWQQVYNNSLLKMAGESGQHLIMGGEAALWSEQADSSGLDGRFWPRAAAFAEVLWAEPSNYWREAETRMLHFRERLVGMGVRAEALKPEWCYHNDGHCSFP